MSLIDDTCDKCGRRFDPMGDPLLTKHPEIGPYAVFCEPCERRSSDDDKALDLAELRRVAEVNSDTQWEREWWKHHAADYWQSAMGGRPYLRDYLTTFDPPTVLALLDRLEAAEAKVARCEALAVKWAEMDWGHEAATLRAALRGDA